MTKMEYKNEYKFKYIIVGQQNVGKSNILLRFVKDKFVEKYIVTIGVDYSSKSIQVGDETVKLEIYDTAGQECFRSLTKNYYQSSTCSLVVYDISSRESFDAVKNWIDDCNNYGPKTQKIILIGNKCDLDSTLRQVSYEEGKEYAEELKIDFYETSALTGQNINDVFNQSASELVQKIRNNEYDLDESNSGIVIKKIRIENGKKKKKCC